MATPNDQCAARRTELRERSLDGLPEEAAPAILRDHLDGCPACRRYAEGLRQAPGLFRTNGLYTPELRHRTLAATAAAPEPIGAGRLILLAGAGLAGFTASAVLPFWLISRLIGLVCPTELCALAGAAAIFLLLGLGAGGAIAVPALTRENTGKAAASWMIWR